MSDFSKRITDIMTRKNLTQKQLAELAHVTESAMSYYVKGERTPRADVLRRLAGALGVTADYLLGENKSAPLPKTELEYLQGFLASMNNEQLYKIEDLLRIVFTDQFYEYDLMAAGSRIEPIDIRYMFRDGAIDPEETPVIKFYADITGVDKTGITFTDGSRIDFEECARNSKYENSKCVAARNIGFNPPYFDFLTTGTITRLVFCSTDTVFFKKKRIDENFVRFQFEINHMGYRTLDLT